MTLLAHGQLADHNGHLLMLAVPVVLMTGLAVAFDVRRWLQQSRHLEVAALLTFAWVLSVFAGFIHLLVTPEHMDEWVGYGVFFIGVGAAQLLWPALVVVRPRIGRSAGLALSIGLVLLWAFTRTAGIPLGPEHGTVEPVGALDALSAAAEVGVAALCLLAVHLSSSGAPSARLRPRNSATT